MVEEKLGFVKVRQGDYSIGISKIGSPVSKFGSLPGAVGVAGMPSVEFFTACISGFVY